MEIDYANFILISEFIRIYIYKYIFDQLLSPTGHLSTSRTLPHTHTALSASINLKRLLFYLQHQEL